MAEQALRDSEERFKNAFEYSSVGMALVALNGRNLQVNRALCEIVGYTEAELLRTDYYSITHPEDVASARELLGQLVEERVPTVRSEKRYCHKHGHEVWVRINVSMVRRDSGEPSHLIVQSEDITDRKLQEIQLQRQLAQITALRTIDMTILASLDVRLTLHVVLDQVVEHLRVDAADVLLYLPYSQTLEYAASRGFRTSLAHGASIRLGEGLAGQAALERRLVQVPNLGSAEDNSTSAQKFSRDRFVSYMGMPLLAKGQVLGVLEIFHRSPLQPDGDWLDFMETLASQAAIALDNARLFQDLQKSNADLSRAYDTTLDGWSRALDLRDKETEGHSARVTDMTLRLARLMGFGEEQLTHVRRGALLHHTSKMGIPDSILLKPGSLDGNE